MMQAPLVKDLIVLAADKDMEFAVRGLLQRQASLGIRNIAADIFVHQHKDPGCLTRAHEFLRAFTKQYEHGLVIFDRDGCGDHDHSRVEIEQLVEARLSTSGWGDRATAIVLDPELEIWVWSDSPEVESVLGWSGRQPRLAKWLEDRGMKVAESTKPSQPKEAVEQVLRHVRKRRSSALYSELASRVSVNRCVDLAFERFKSVLQCWFSASR